MFVFEVMFLQTQLSCVIRTRIRSEMIRTKHQGVDERSDTFIFFKLDGTMNKTRRQKNGKPILRVEKVMQCF